MKSVLIARDRAALALGAFLSLTLCAASSTAQAHAIVSLDTAGGANGIDVVVQATTTLVQPVVRIDRGRVRLWFPGVGDDSFLDRNGDGRIVRTLAARPGPADMALVTIRLFEARTLAPEDVVVTLDGSRARVHLAVVLPVAPTPAPVVAPQLAPVVAAPVVASPVVTAPPLAAPAPVVAAPAPVAAPAAIAAPPVATAPARAPIVAAAPVAPSPPAPSPAATAPSAAEPFTAHPVATPHATPTTDARPISGSSTAIPMLALFALLLGTAWVVVKVLAKRRAAATGQPIEVVATHRLGAKHSLVVVRALGQEHLIAVQGDSSRRLASRDVPIPETEADLRSLRSLEHEVREPPAKPARRTSTPSIAPAKNPASEGPFGAALLRVVAGRAHAEQAAAAAKTPAGQAPSESVTGLLKLRAKVAR